MMGNQAVRASCRLQLLLLPSVEGDLSFPPPLHSRVFLCIAYFVGSAHLPVTPVAVKQTPALTITPLNSSINGTLGGLFIDMNYDDAPRSAGVCVHMLFFPCLGF